VEFLHPPGFATPRHIHHRADEAFYVLSGSIHGFCGDRVWAAGPDAFAWLPKGVPHGYSVERAYWCVRWRLLCRVDSTHSSLAWVSLPSGHSCLLRSSCPTSRFSSPLLRPMGKRSSVRHQNGPRREARRRRRQVIGPQKCCVMRTDGCGSAGIYPLPRLCQMGVSPDAMTSTRL
jgi:Cupin domain